MNVPSNDTDAGDLLARVRYALGSVYDPEFGVSVVDLGLIYDVRIVDGHVQAEMTLTSMFCPAGQVMLDGVRSAIQGVDGVRSAEVALVWEPAWTPERLSPAAREQLGWKGTTG